MSTNLYVGNLPWSITNDKLEEMFAQVGQVVSATVITDKFSGRSKGFGFVEMASAEEAKAAIEKYEGFEMEGRALRVNEARPRQPREDRGGDRGGYRH